jgi:hypothetical protein
VSQNQSGEIDWVVGRNRLGRSRSQREIKEQGGPTSRTVEIDGYREGTSRNTGGNDPIISAMTIQRTLHCYGNKGAAGLANKEGVLK